MSMVSHFPTFEACLWLIWSKEFSDGWVTRPITSKGCQVRQRSYPQDPRYGYPVFQRVDSRVLSILNSNSKLPATAVEIYNFDTQSIGRGRPSSNSICAEMNLLFYSSGYTILDELSDRMTTPRLEKNAVSGWLGSIILAQMGSER